jgi:hypothetical protein
MDIEVILGQTLMIVGLIITFIAFPSQIIKNYKDKKFGISIFLILCGIAIYSLRIPYTLIRNDYYILIPDVFGFLIHMVLLYQYFIYRKN